MSRSQIKIEMKMEFDNFLSGLPPFYFKNIRHELKKLNISTSLFNEQFSFNLNPDLVLYINSITNQAKQSMEKYNENDDPIIREDFKEFSIVFIGKI